LRKRRQETPADEPLTSVLVHVWLPFGLALLLLIASLVLDLSCSGTHWVKRSGAILVLVGGYIAFHERRWHERYVLDRDNTVCAYHNPEIWYKWLALALALTGAILAGYADLIV